MIKYGGTLKYKRFMFPKAGEGGVYDLENTIYSGNKRGEWTVCAGQQT